MLIDIANEKEFLKKKIKVSEKKCNKKMKAKYRQMNVCMFVRLGQIMLVLEYM